MEQQRLTRLRGDLFYMVDSSNLPSDAHSPRIQRSGRVETPCRLEGIQLIAGMRWINSAMAEFYQPHASSLGERDGAILELCMG